MLKELSDWIEATHANRVVQTVPWIIPSVQTVHILAISVVISSMAMLDMRLVGLTGLNHSIKALSDRFMPWLWGALLVLLLTGAILIVGEPGRSLGNWVFQLKMLLLALAVLITLLFQHVLRRNVDRWDESSTLKTAARFTGVISLMLWIAIIVCGRWIAYVAAD